MTVFRLKTFGGCSPQTERLGQLIGNVFRRYLCIDFNDCVPFKCTSFVTGHCTACQAVVNNTFFAVGS